MSLRDDISLLSQVPLFSQLDDEPVRLLAFGADKRGVAKGQTLVSAGSAPAAAYVVAEGSFSVTMPSTKGTSRLADAVPGTLLCELALVSDIECRISAVAGQDSEVIVIGRALFHRLMEEFPDVAARIDQRIRENLATMIRDITMMEARFS